MTGKERMLQALRFEQPDRPPHFEAMFELEREAFGLAFPDRRNWDGCSGDAKVRLIDGCMEIYARIIDRYHWDALPVWWPWSDPDGVRAAKQAFGDRLLIGSLISGSVWTIDGIADWTRFAVDLVERPHDLHAQARLKTAAALATIDRLCDAGADFIFLANDVAWNRGPFISPARFREFVAPYLHEQVQHIRRRGCLPFVHSDGNLMAILDQYLELDAACLHSIDPMAGMDIKEVKRRCHGRLAVMGNVQCNLLQDGPAEAIRASAAYCLEHASPGGGYVFSTSNTIFPDMPLANYECMLDAYRTFCARPGQLRQAS